MHEVIFQHLRKECFAEGTKYWQIKQLINLICIGTLHCSYNTNRELIQDTKTTMSPCFNIHILHIFSLGFLSAAVNMTFTAWEGFGSFGSSVYFSNTLTLIHIPWGRKGWVKQKDNTRQIMSRTSLKLKGAFILWKLFGDRTFYTHRS